MILPAVAWKPDQPDLVGGASSTVKNCLARTEASYGPMPALAVYSDALTARAQGAIGVTDSDGNAFAFAGDAAKLYKAGAGSVAWSDVSKVGGYTTASDERWSGTFFTPNRVLLTNFADAIQSFVLGTSAAFADLAAAAPKARYIAVIRDFVMAANTFDTTDGNRPTRVWWPAIGNPTSWPTPGTSAAAQVQSDFQDLNVGDFGWITGIIGGLTAADGVVVMERGLVRTAYQGPPTVFGFYPIEGARGSPAPGSIAQLGSFFIYLGDDDLYLCDGASSAPLGAEQWAKYLYSRIDQSKMDRVSAAFDPINKIYFLAYPGPDNVDGNPNEVLAYNWKLKRGTLIDGLGSIELLFRSLSFGYTLEQLDSVSPSIETLPFGLDSRAWTGGKLLLSAFDANHKLNYFTGANLAPTVDTAETQLIRNRRAFVSSVRPLVDGGSPSVALGTRERLKDAVSWGAAVAMDSYGNSPQLSSGRYHRARVTLPAGEEWEHISGAEIEDDAIQPDGSI